MLNDVDLIWVATDEQKWRAVQNDISLQPTPLRIPRERKSQPPVVLETLIQVETRV
jgi:ribonuclease E